MKCEDKKRGELSFQRHQILKFDSMLINVLIFSLTVILDNSGKF